MPEVRKYLEDENEFFSDQMKDTKHIQKKLFDEIKARIKLDDESLPYRDKNYEYWTKTTTEGNYSIKLRRKIGEKEAEEIWNGDLEKKKLQTKILARKIKLSSYLATSCYQLYSLNIYIMLFIKDIHIVFL